MRLDPCSYCHRDRLLQALGPQTNLDVDTLKGKNSEFGILFKIYCLRAMVGKKLRLRLSFP